jgi:hypothetical protein
MAARAAHAAPGSVVAIDLVTLSYVHEYSQCMAIF